MEVWVWRIEILSGSSRVYGYGMRVVTKTEDGEHEVVSKRGYSSVDELIKSFTAFIKEGRSRIAMSQFIAIHETPPWDFEIDVASSVRCLPLDSKDLAKIQKEIESL